MWHPIQGLLWIQSFEIWNFRLWGVTDWDYCIIVHVKVGFFEHENIGVINVRNDRFESLGSTSLPCYQFISNTRTFSGTHHSWNGFYLHLNLFLPINVTSKTKNLFCKWTPFSLYERDHITIKISVHFLRFSLLGAIHERRHQFFEIFFTNTLD